MEYLDTQKSIIRQNALTHADAMFSKFVEYPSDAETIKANEHLFEQYFKFAERCENWVRRKDVVINVDAEMKELNESNYGSN